MPEAVEPSAAADDWRAALEALSGGGDPPAMRDSGDGAKVRALALQFELRRRRSRREHDWQGPKDEPARAGGAVDRLGIRPVAAGARGAWVKSGLTWQNIGFQGASQGFDPEQARWFAQLALIKGRSPSVYTSYGSEWITFDEYDGPLVWAMLADAERLGIALVGSPVTPDIRLRSLAEVVLDATDDLDGFRLTPTVVFDGDPRTAVDVRPVGVHGLYRYDFRAGRLELAPTDGALTSGQLAAIGSPESVRVPSPEIPDFLARSFHSLARRIPVTSFDGSFEPPPLPPATLVARVRFEPGEVARLDWRWEHGDGRSTPVETPDSLASFDPNAAGDPGDLDVLARVLDELVELPIAPIILRGADALWLADRVLPGLRRLERVRLDVEGEPPGAEELVGETTFTIRTVESTKPDWFDLGVMIRVAGRTIPFMPLFRALAKGERRLRLVDRSYLDLRHPAFDPLRDLLEEADGIEEWETGVRVHRTRANVMAAFEDLAEFEGPAVEWRALVAGLEHGAVEPLDAPAGLALPLRPYQLDGFRWLAFLHRHGLGGVLADDMGLGKTAQTLALVAHAVEARGGADVSGAPFLVVAPTSVASNWIAEAARFTPGLRAASVTATGRTRRETIAETAARSDIVVTTYAVLRLEAAAFAAVEWGGLVLDEAQFVKNAATKAHAAARDIRAPFRLAVTGTPVENDLSELWAIMRLVAPGLFPSRRAFDERYRRPIEQDGNTERLERLRTRVRPLMLRRTKDQVAPELPAKQEQVLSVELAPAHRRLYDATLQRERQKLLGLVDDLDRQRFIVYRSLTLLRMLALDASLIGTETGENVRAGIPSAKLDVLFEHLDDLIAEGHGALVFSQFTSFLGKVGERLEERGIAFAWLDGSTSARARDAAIARFRSGEASVFCISLKAGGFGLNLTEADYVFLLDPWWNPASEEQAVDRAHRIGQDKPVNVYRLVASGTVEEKVMALKAKKGELVAKLIARSDETDASGGASGAEATLLLDDLRGLLDG
ncbi:DEAD/DEAH box helicase [Agromyces protaetiae]|uniref:DEAD/DEAH box helicase n=1 Tax=Agromyces protaetiae TaxID=2509455 RepID=A0A4P6FDD9_9MICO|nr:DEAD/DEAH box helicase [Agromyces protaetiae]QAY73003.1 DEAD/DEAH box helicase [Agromyces protaetiae]